jgi:hypothetical protein
MKKKVGVAVAVVLSGLAGFGIGEYRKVGLGERWRKAWERREGETQRVVDQLVASNQQTMAACSVTISSMNRPTYSAPPPSAEQHIYWHDTAREQREYWNMLGGR